MWLPLFHSPNNINFQEYTTLNHLISHKIKTIRVPSFPLNSHVSCCRTEEEILFCIINLYRPPLTVPKFNAMLFSCVSVDPTLSSRFYESSYYKYVTGLNIHLVYFVISDDFRVFSNIRRRDNGQNFLELVLLFLEGFVQRVA